VQPIKIKDTPQKLRAFWEPRIELECTYRIERESNRIELQSSANRNCDRRFTECRVHQPLMTSTAVFDDRSRSSSATRLSSAEFSRGKVVQCRAGSEGEHCQRVLYALYGARNHWWSCSRSSGPSISVARRRVARLQSIEQRVGQTGMSRTSVIQTLEDHGNDDGLEDKESDEIENVGRKNGLVGAPIVIY